MLFNHARYLGMPLSCSRKLVGLAMYFHFGTYRLHKREIARIISCMKYK